MAGTRAARACSLQAVRPRASDLARTLRPARDPLLPSRVGVHHFQDDTSLVSDPKEGRDEKERGKKESSTYVQLMMLRKLHYEVLYKYSDTRNHSRVRTFKFYTINDCLHVLIQREIIDINDVSIRIHKTPFHLPQNRWKTV